eukprot:scaffold334_cov241-Pinguiococcus_pyrenoidosus.AAC.64
MLRQSRGDRCDETLQYGALAPRVDSSRRFLLLLLFLLLPCLLFGADRLKSLRHNVRSGSGVTAVGALHLRLRHQRAIGVPDLVIVDARVAHPRGSLGVISEGVEEASALELINKMILLLGREEGLVEVRCEGVVVGAAKGIRGRLERFVAGRRSLQAVVGDGQQVPACVQNVQSHFDPLVPVLGLRTKRVIRRKVAAGFLPRALEVQVEGLSHFALDLHAHRHRQLLGHDGKELLDVVLVILDVRLDLAPHVQLLLDLVDLLSNVRDPTCERVDASALEELDNLQRDDGGLRVRIQHRADHVHVRKHRRVQEGILLANQLDQERQDSASVLDGRTATRAENGHEEVLHAAEALHQSLQLIHLGEDGPRRHLRIRGGDRRERHHEQAPHDAHRFHELHQEPQVRHKDGAVLLGNVVEDGDVRRALERRLALANLHKQLKILRLKVCLWLIHEERRQDASKIVFSHAAVDESERVFHMNPDESWDGVARGGYQPRRHADEAFGKILVVQELEEQRHGHSKRSRVLAYVAVHAVQQRFKSHPQLRSVLGCHFGSARRNALHRTQDLQRELAQTSLGQAYGNALQQLAEGLLSAKDVLVDVVGCGEVRDQSAHDLQMCVNQGLAAVLELEILDAQTIDHLGLHVRRHLAGKQDGPDRVEHLAEELARFGRVRNRCEAKALHTALKALWRVAFKILRG